MPDELLNARDDGQVIFFCGAGVSRARAGLPDFIKLAQKVVESLRASADSPARRLLEATKTQITIEGVGALIPADRIFGLLEREYSVGIVRSAVAAALRPCDTVDLSAHRILLDLARGPDGEVRLVTTNFDLLFEACDHSLTFSAPPSLADPRRGRRFSGIIHLHGHVTPAYDGAHDDEFVLSSADFGRAYLSDGWATRFIGALLENFKIVFVGYTADDPPVQYLLEALNTSTPEMDSLYAFQDGIDETAQALWRHKGVNAIAFDAADNFKALWQTLDAWAARARDPEAWYEAVLSRAMAGPEHLAPFERGQVQHIVSTAAGVRRFLNKKPPADWLCVFDSLVRYPRLSDARLDEITFDPFNAYGLDHDPLPTPASPNNRPAQLKRPAGIWDAFELTGPERTRSDEHIRRRIE